MSKLTLYSAGYSGSRLCRNGGSSFNSIEFEPSNIVFFTSGWKYNLFYTRNKQWYGCGDNESGQIGCSSSELSEITLVPDLLMTPIWAACGDKMTAIVNSQGELYVSGSGYGNFRKPVPIDKPIRFVACGTERVVAIPHDTGIFCSDGGNNNFKYLAQDITFVDCAAGQYHYLAISDQGVAYSWGRRKACGQGRKYNNQTPAVINVSEPVKFKRCFAYNIASFLIDENNNIWSSGANNYGQIGLGRLNKTNTFQKIEPFWGDSEIIHIACGDSMSYFLALDGKLYACGEGDNARLMMNDNDAVRTPTLCSKTSSLNVVYMTAGCSHIVLLAGDSIPDFLTHPIVSSNRKTIFTHVPYFIPFSTKTIKPTQMDISTAGYVSLGFSENDGVILVDKKGDQEPSTVLGVLMDNSLVLSSKNQIQLLKDDPIAIHKKLRVVKRMNPLNNDQEVVLSHEEGRSSLHYDLDTSELMCNLFGFRCGESVSHECFGNGKVAGVFGGKIFFSWEQDDNKISTTADSSLSHLHSVIQITQPVKRTVQRMKISTSEQSAAYIKNYANVEISPCNLLTQYNLHVNDFVKFNMHYGKIIGQLGIYAVVQSINGQQFDLFNVHTLELIRTYSDDIFTVGHKAFNGTIVNVAVNCKKTDAFLPFDRILTRKGFATVIGRSPNNLNELWILPDSAFKLNAGIVVCKDTSSFRIIRRIDAPSSETDYDNSLDNQINQASYPGDVVIYNEMKYLVLGRNASQQIILKNKDEQITVKPDAQIEVIFRSDLECTRRFPSRQNFKLFFEVNSARFRGLRVVPGDKVQTSTGMATVIGMKANDVWIKYDDAIGASTIPQQMVFDPNLFKVLENVSDSL